MDLQAKVCMNVVLGKDLCSIGKSSICQLFEGKGDFVFIHTEIFLFLKTEILKFLLIFMNHRMVWVQSDHLVSNLIPPPLPWARRDTFH